jgi:hypothetical protein
LTGVLVKARAPFSNFRVETCFSKIDFGQTDLHVKIEICAELDSNEAQGWDHLPIQVRNEESSFLGCFFEGDNYERCNYLPRREIWILVLNPDERESSIFT